MTFNKLCSLIAKREAKKVSVSIANIREVMRIYFDLLAEPSEELIDLVNAECDKRTKKKAKATKGKKR